MSGTSIALLLLGLVDVAALSIGISIRRKVTGIIREVAGRIEAEVKKGIAQALTQLLAIAYALLPEDDPRREQLAGAEQLLERLGG